MENAQGMPTLAAVPVFCSNSDDFFLEFSGDRPDFPPPDGVGVLVHAKNEFWLVTAFHIVFYPKTRETAQGEQVKKLVKYCNYIWVPVADAVSTHVSWYRFRSEAGKATRLGDDWADCLVFRMVTSSGNIAKPTSLANSEFGPVDFDLVRGAAVSNVVNPRPGSLLRLCCFRDGWAPDRRGPFTLDGKCQANREQEITTVFATQNGDSGAPVFALDKFQGETWGLAGLHVAVRNRNNPGDHGVASHISVKYVFAAMDEQDLVYDESFHFELHRENCVCNYEPCRCP